MAIHQQSISKKISLFTLFCMMTSLSFAKLSDDAIANIYENKLEGAAKYLEFCFVFQPNNKIQSATMDMTISLSAIAAGLFLTSKIQYLENNIGKVDGQTLIASSIIAVSAGYMYACKIDKAIKHETLVNFLNNWSHHKKFLPEEFVAAFDELAAAFEKSETKRFSAEQVSEIFELVQHYIEHCFEKRYPKEKKSTDVLGSLKTITEIGKNLSPK